MQAATADIPVIVCCESVKFSGKVALDSIVLNEVAPAEELLLPSVSKPKEESPKEESEPKPKGKKDGADEETKSKIKTLDDWKEISNLQVLNLMYDVTPAEYIRMVICEYGSLPPSSVPVVHRLANEGM
jgi:translation initiation factor eIF-2B subunit delta